jgi:tetratricopeptide (TPR) repeat protein
MSAASVLTRLLLAAAATGPPNLDDPALLRQAEDAFRAAAQARDKPDEARPLFRQAAVCYEVLRQHGHDNANLDCNLGNARLLAGDLAGAILAYREGLALAPTNRRLRASLAYARRQVVREPGGFDRPPDHGSSWLASLLVAPFLFVAASLYALGWLGIAAGWAASRMRWIAAGGAILLLSAALGTGLWWAEGSREAARTNPVVVIAQDRVHLRTGNGRAYPRRSDVPLHRGVEARLLFARGNWLQIELPGLGVGWVPRSQVLVPPSAPHTQVAVDRALGS